MQSAQQTKRFLRAIEATCTPDATYSSIEPGAIRAVHDL